MVPKAASPPPNVLPCCIRSRINSPPSAMVQPSGIVVPVQCQTPLHLPVKGPGVGVGVGARDVPCAHIALKSTALIADARKVDRRVVVFIGICDGFTNVRGLRA